MLTWDIAKLLIEKCDSPEDVTQVIVTLRSPSSIEEVCSLLTAFSNGGHPSTNSKQTSQTMQGMRSQSPSAGDGKSTSSRTKKEPVDSSSLAAAKQLEALFRSKGMTNQQVEQWVNSNFSARAILGKDSLRKYLTRVLNNVDLGVRNRILATAQRLVNEDYKGTSEIKDYWDELDKSFSVIE